jgi:hypothetical protein
MEIKGMELVRVETLSQANKMFFLVGQVDWLIEQGLIYEEETCP